MVSENEEARVGLHVEQSDMGERDREPGIEDEAVPIDARTGADRIQRLPLAEDDGTSEMTDWAWSQKA